MDLIWPKTNLCGGVSRRGDLMIIPHKSCDFVVDVEIVDCISLIQSQKAFFDVLKTKIWRRKNSEDTFLLSPIPTPVLLHNLFWDFPTRRKVRRTGNICKYFPQRYTTHNYFYRNVIKEMKCKDLVFICQDLPITIEEGCLSGEPIILMVFVFRSLCVI